MASGVHPKSEFFIFWSALGKVNSHRDLPRKASGMPSYETSRFAPPPAPTGLPSADTMPPDDALMALSLITIWAMHTGRSLRPVPISELTVQELEDFWADDQMLPAKTDTEPTPLGPRTTAPDMSVNTRRQAARDSLPSGAEPSMHLPTFTRPSETSSMSETLIGLDIVGFSGPRRTEDVQRLLCDTMYGVAEQAFSMTSLSWEDTRRDNRGDGMLIAVPSAVRACDIVEPLHYHLAARLRRHNRLANDLTHLRLRMAIHVGEVEYGDHAMLGHDIIDLCRLLDSHEFRQVMAKNPRADLGVLVSERLYQGAAAKGAIDPDAYTSLTVSHGQNRTRAHLWLPPTYH
ncbi:hypothetical protein ACSNOI_24350 [Actinomadura kijaniata]|uniref:hypothetical protein n=1 Tax=Actinomadura kijaniata TaxID=46161 RepID=UPI003F1CEABE